MASLFSESECFIVDNFVYKVKKNADRNGLTFVDLSVPISDVQIERLDYGAGKILVSFTINEQKVYIGNITTYSLFEVMLNSSVINNKIMQPVVFLNDESNFSIVLADSQKHLQAIQERENLLLAKQNKLSKKEVEIGDYVTLHKQEISIQYLGRYTVLLGSNSRTNFICNRTEQFYLFKDENRNVFYGFKGWPFVYDRRAGIKTTTVSEINHYIYHDRRIYLNVHTSATFGSLLVDFEKKSYQEMMLKLKELFPERTVFDNFRLFTV